MHIKSIFIAEISIICFFAAFDANLMTKERRLNESGQYFLLSGQEISLDCSSIIAKCAIQHSALDANTVSEVKSINFS